MGAISRRQAWAFERRTAELRELFPAPSPNSRFFEDDAVASAMARSYSCGLTLDASTLAMFRSFDAMRQIHVGDMAVRYARARLRAFPLHEIGAYAPQRSGEGAGQAVSRDARPALTLPIGTHSASLVPFADGEAA